MSRMLCLFLLMTGPVAFGEARADAAPIRSTAVPAAVRRKLKLDSFYEKYVDANGISVVGSAKVNDFALAEGAFVIGKMLEGRADIAKALADSGAIVIVMASTEFTTDIPQYRGMKPAAFWDRRARGLGGTPPRFVTSCGEENVLRYPGDPYRTESILVHEFAHTIHAVLRKLDETFDRRLEAAYDAAMAKGLWKGKYAANHRGEYWAEAVQSWFDTNRPPDHDHNHVDTREELRKYDPKLAGVVEEVLGDRPWRYRPPQGRWDDPHLRGYDPKKAPQFAWPARVERAFKEHQAKKTAESKKKNTASKPAR